MTEEKLMTMSPEEAASLRAAAERLLQSLDMPLLPKQAPPIDRTGKTWNAGKRCNGT
jgi:hypothetical protein